MISIDGRVNSVDTKHDLIEVENVCRNDTLIKNFLADES